MAEKGRRDFCIECRKETEYLLQKKDIVKNTVPGAWVWRGDDTEISGRNRKCSDG